ncbi:MAG: arginine N-succinyltransferase [Gammaproteobacteria bacterium]|nr:arginine N-succinyltransferase [Gammaproteobacteria bacterium]
MNDITGINGNGNSRGFQGKHIAWIVLGTILLTAAVTYWVVRTYIYARDFEPVVLSQTEQQQLNKKLVTLGYQPDPMQTNANNKNNKENDFDTNGRLIPQKYSEDVGARDLSFSEKELNSLVASNTDMAKKLAIDLSQDLVSARILVPVDKDFPVLGGKTLRVSAGVEIAYKDGRPRVVLKGVTVMGVPIPNSWLGGLKNIDLISEFGDEQGFWKGFSEGVENIHVEDGELKIKLKE